MGLVFMGSMASSQTVIADDSDVSYEEAIRGFDGEKFPQVYCMALNVYYEARGSNMADMYAVADVVLNRVDDARFPDTICDVVHDGYRKGRRDCQFSWYCDGKSDKIPPQDRDLYSQILGIAEKIYYGYDSFLVYDFTKGATHYHAFYVDPKWSKHKDVEKIMQLDDHIFYRWN